jgi:tetratricopeptide (TPR) repeat protein
MTTQELFDKAHALMEAGEFREAKALFFEARDADGRREEAWFGVADSHGRMGCNHLALDAWDVVLGINSQNDRAWVEKGKTFLRLADGQLNEFDVVREERTPAQCFAEAFRCFDKAIEVNPRQDEAWYQKGCTNQRLGRTAEAIAQLEHARDIGGPWSHMAKLALR